MAEKRHYRSVAVWHHDRQKMLGGYYFVGDGMVRVISGYGAGAMQIDGRPPKTLAKIMLRELADEYGGWLSAARARRP